MPIIPSDAMQPMCGVLKRAIEGLAAHVEPQVQERDILSLYVRPEDQDILVQAKKLTQPDVGFSRRLNYKSTTFLVSITSFLLPHYMYSSEETTTCDVEAEGRLAAWCEARRELSQEFMEAQLFLYYTLVRLSDPRLLPLLSKSYRTLFDRNSELGQSVARILPHKLFTRISEEIESGALPKNIPAIPKVVWDGGKVLDGLLLRAMLLGDGISTEPNHTIYSLDNPASIRADSAMSYPIPEDWSEAIGLDCIVSECREWALLDVYL